MNEREIFEKWYFDKYYSGTTACWLKVFAKFENLKGSEKSYNGKYINDRVLLAYEAWQASASREGYKLVPKSFIADIHDMALDGKYLRETDQSQEKFTEIHELCKEIMIGAVE